MRLLRALTAGVAAALSLAAQTPAHPPASVDSPAFRDFNSRVQEYLKLQASVPRQKTTKKHEDIEKHRKALAENIRALRANAKPGDIFTPEISQEFRRVINESLKGVAATATRSRKAIHDTPVPHFHLCVNCSYPESLPVATIPPDLLLKLPSLPTQMSYRIVEHDFILLDKEARVIVDFITGVIP